MRVVVTSCYGYRDAWIPFHTLFERYWPNQTYEMWLDRDREPWCSVVSTSAVGTDPILLLMEDFFLTAPVNQSLIDRAVEQLEARNAGMIRLYPCPGSDEDYGDPHYGIVKKGSPYRISCQASIWRPDFLRKIASQFKSPWEFEIEGTKYAESLPDEVLAFKRDVQPWPISYECTAIVKGRWTQSAKRLCEREGIAVDWSMRPIEA